MRTEESPFPARGRAQPSRLAAAAMIGLVLFVAFMVIATSWSVARL